jgi:Glycosyl hydrolase family 65 central catalytic domain
MSPKWAIPTTPLLHRHCHDVKTASDGIRKSVESSLEDPYAEAVRLWSRDREIHISSDIADAVWQYWQATGDDIWMRDDGAEIILDTDRFWMSRVDWNAKHERYEICGVIGADEYHEQVNNNAYTNRLVQWHLEKAIASQHAGKGFGLDVSGAAGIDKGMFWQTGASLQRVGISYTLAAIVGISLGIAIGTSELLSRALDPLFLFLRTVPPLAWDRCGWFITRYSNELVAE